ncbi:pyridoxal phosphate-dependent transferase [Crepidotus variabilis]|uniref:Pyridoxal phosphate-dependent transferase n=1 Tax=Crepidotus variabilis TaxID=179855 RepID=A0A9P6JN12_9AGAR|nr:pyridoxal phosphate-dependent transferase [Crepidotus variabilis]
MTSLFKHLRIHQIFGANTDVGKTILTTALVRASAVKGKNVFYLKPVSTGALEDADDLHVTRYTTQKAANFTGAVQAECLFRFDEPVSPHLAAQIKGEKEGRSRDSMIPSDETFVNAIANRILGYANKQQTTSHMYIETAGGVHSPALSGTTQADCYRPLFLPTILIGDSRLGGISSTISSYESLLLRGYIVDAVLLFQDDYYQNGEYLKPYFMDRGIHMATIAPPPMKLPDSKENFISTDQYYASITRKIDPENETAAQSVSNVVNHLDKCHENRIEELASMPRRSLDTLWWPFVQHGLVNGEKDVNVIDSAYGDFFSVTNKSSLRSRDERWCGPSDETSKVLPQSSSAPSGSLGPPTNILTPQFDGSASWWTQTVGHAHPSLTLAAARASGRYGHVMFPQATHLPALQLAERLVHDGPGKGWASRAFFSDNGSTGMEVALKMGLRAYTTRHAEGGELSTKEAKKKLGVLALKGSYHGDTIGVMDACEEGVYTCEWHDAKGYWLDPPTVSIQDGQVIVTLPPSLSSASSATSHQQKVPSLAWVYSVEERLQTPLARAYAFHITNTLESLKQKGHKFGALVLEPLIMGAGGMIFVDPLYQRVLIDVVRNRSSSKPNSSWSGLPVIFDEVFVGLNRLGITTTSSILGVKPDISVHAKCLTGGLIPLCATLASQSIFEAFLGSNKADALLHGHSYTAHPIGCEVANETLRLMDKLSLSDDWIAAKASWSKEDESESPVWSLWNRDFIVAVSGLPQVKEVMTLGSVLAIKVQDPSGGYTSQSAQNILQSLSWLSQSDDVLSSAPGGAPFNIHYRTLGDVAYFITSLNTRSSVIRSIEDKIWQALSTI